MTYDTREKEFLVPTNIVQGRCVVYSFKIHGHVFFMYCDVNNFTPLFKFVVLLFEVIISKNHSPVSRDIRCKRILMEVKKQKIDIQFWRRDPRTVKFITLQIPSAKIIFVFLVLSKNMLIATT